MSWPFRVVKKIVDIFVTTVVWTYFTVGGIVCFCPFFLFVFLFSRDREGGFQKIIHFFYRGFFWLARTITPGLQIEIREDVRKIRSSVVICNHLSYLDPILLLSVWKAHKTIVKGALFRAPCFGWFPRQAGYIPAGGGGDMAAMMVDRVEKLGEFLGAGGNLFVFPEGTRSEDGTLGSFETGAFKIAGRCRAPIEVLMISNTGRLYTPGRVLFNTCVRNTIRIERISRIEPEFALGPAAVSDLSELSGQDGGERLTYSHTAPAAPEPLSTVRLVGDRGPSRFVVRIGRIRPGPRNGGCRAKDATRASARGGRFPETGR
jgi:1-acyl-sn-glycerol-3-phosphate acyltransferase